MKSRRGDPISKLGTIIVLLMTTFVTWSTSQTTENPQTTTDSSQGNNTGNDTRRLPCSVIDSITTPVSDKNGLIDERFRWEDFRVYVDPVFNTREYNLINNSLNTLREAMSGCITFTIFPQGSPRPNSGDYVHIRNGGGCSSFVGRIGNAQTITLARNGCMFMGTIMHEMIHALGFHHEQTRMDRDNHVTIMWNNIAEEAKMNFEMQNDTTAFDIEYNLRSIMHYGPFDFSRNNQPTIVSNNGEPLGATENLQASDIEKLRRMYNCQTSDT